MIILPISSVVRPASCVDRAWSACCWHRSSHRCAESPRPPSADHWHASAARQTVPDASARSPRCIAAVLFGCLDWSAADAQADLLRRGHTAHACGSCPNKGARPCLLLFRPRHRGAAEADLTIRTSREQADARVQMEGGEALIRRQLVALIRR